MYNRHVHLGDVRVLRLPQVFYTDGKVCVYPRSVGATLALIGNGKDFICHVLAEGSVVAELFVKFGIVFEQTQHGTL